MAERIREVVVTIEVDTNKRTHRAVLVLQSDEDLGEFSARIEERLVELTETD